jgi:hypothetical protein
MTFRLDEIVKKQNHLKLFGLFPILQNSKPSGRNKKKFGMVAWLSNHSLHSKERKFFFKEFRILKGRTIIIRTSDSINRIATLHSD